MATFMNIEPATGQKERGKSRGRKPTNGATQKKLPQRGMGVEKLERLRLQERWKKMAEAFTAPQLDQSVAASCGATYPTVPSGSSVPKLLGVASYGVPTINVGVPVGLSGWDMGMKVQQRTWNGGFSGFGGDHGSDQVSGIVDYPENRAKAQDLRVQFGSVLGTSKELSSMPNLQHCVPEYRCEFCFKKKRLCGENRRLNEGLNFNQTSHVLPINGGQNLPQQHFENNQNFNDLINGFSKREPGSSSAYSNHNLPQGVEVVAIHRRGIKSSVGGGNHVFAEYEFFPRRSTSSKLVEEASVTRALGGEASDDTNPTFVDLSLKLSY